MPFTTSTHMTAKCQSNAPPSHWPSAMLLGKWKPNKGEASKICQPEPIITKIAIALIQWVTRTQTGWIVVPAVVVVMASAVIASLPLDNNRASSNEYREWPGPRMHEPGHG